MMSLNEDQLLFLEDDIVDSEQDLAVVSRNNSNIIDNIESPEEHVSSNSPVISNDHISPRNIFQTVAENNADSSSCDASLQNIEQRISTNNLHIATFEFQELMQQQQLHQLYRMQQAQLRPQDHHAQLLMANFSFQPPPAGHQQVVYVPVPVPVAIHPHFLFHDGRFGEIPITNRLAASSGAPALLYANVPVDMCAISAGQRQERSGPYIIPADSSPADSSTRISDLRKKKCSAADCNGAVDGKTAFCRAHRSARRCQEDGCIKCAQGGYFPNLWMPA